MHRDIKPDNVLLSGDSAAVADFGIATALAAPTAGDTTNETSGTAMTSVGMPIGTPAYMAPEQAAADPDIDHHADLYSFGCMAYELLPGRPPFAERTPQRLLAAHMAVPWAELHVSRLVNAAASESPSTRASSAADPLCLLRGRWRVCSHATP